MKLSGVGNILRSPSHGLGSRECVSQELLILREAERFRRLVALAWDRTTIYPKSEYIAGCSQGQCGVTNYGFGLWLAWHGIADQSQMFFEEGSIVTAANLPLGDDHTWLRIDGVDDGYTQPDLSMRFDLAGDQFSGIDIPEVVQYADYFYPDPDRPIGNWVYSPEAITRFPDYDADRFNGRLNCFMSNIYAASVLPN